MDLQVRKTGPNFGEIFKNGRKIYEGQIGGNNMKEGYGRIFDGDTEIYTCFTQDKILDHSRALIKIGNDQEYDGYINKEKQFQGEGQLRQNGIIIEEGLFEKGRLIERRQVLLFPIKEIVSPSSEISINRMQNQSINSKRIFAQGKPQNLENRPDGFGELLYPDGKKYEGNWKSNKINGKGRVTYPNNSFFEGDFKDFLKEGNGMFISENEKIQGVWTENKLNGLCEIIFENGDFYQGNVVNNKMHGKGFYRWANMDVYEGDFTNGERSGVGTFTMKSGRSYEGEWVNDRPNGHGKMMYENGEWYHGEWANGKYYGIGVYNYPIGECFILEHSKGELKKVILLKL